MFFKLNPSEVFCVIAIIISCLIMIATGILVIKDGFDTKDYDIGFWAGWLSIFILAFYIVAIIVNVGII